MSYSKFEDLMKVILNELTLQFKPSYHKPFTFKLLNLDPLTIQDADDNIILAQIPNEIKHLLEPLRNKESIALRPCSIEIERMTCREVEGLDISIFEILYLSQGEGDSYSKVQGISIPFFIGNEGSEFLTEEGKRKVNRYLKERSVNWGSLVVSNEELQGLVSLESRVSCLMEKSIIDGEDRVNRLPEWELDEKAKASLRRLAKVMNKGELVQRVSALDLEDFESKRVIRSMAFKNEKRRQEDPGEKIGITKKKYPMSVIQEVINTYKR